MDTKEKKRILDEVSEKFNTRADYTEEKYIVRKQYEEEYEAAFRRQKSIVVKGNSGSGKTWLTSHVLRKNGKEYCYINMSKVKHAGSLMNYFKLNIGPVRVETDEKIVAKAKIPCAEGGGEVRKKYEIGTDYYLEYLKLNLNKYIVFDNMEAITNNEAIIDEIGGIITLIDDNEVLMSATRLILIGTNSDIVNIFRKLPNYETISNRIYELNEIKGFTDTECLQYVVSRFKETDLCIKNEIKFSKYIYENTSGMPQNVSDLCQFIAETHIKNNLKEINICEVSKKNLFDDAEKNWVRASFLGEYTTISSLFAENENDPKKRRNNYILYGISVCESREFSSDLIFANLSIIFQGKADGIGKRIVNNYLQVLSNESKNCNILVEKRSGIYKVKSSKTLRCMRLILKNKGDEIVLLDCEEV